MVTAQTTIGKTANVFIKIEVKNLRGKVKVANKKQRKSAAKLDLPQAYDNLRFMEFGNLLPKRVLYLLGFGLLIRLVLAWLPEKYFFYIVYDDAYYYFSIARNLVTRGMFSADGLNLTNGFHPLWLFVITPIYLFFHSYHWLSIHLVIMLSAFFDVAVAFLIYKTLQNLGKPNVGFWAAAFYLVNPYGLFYTMNGLETAQNNFFLALLVFLSLKATAEWLKTGWFLFGTVCGLTLLSRTDNVFVVAVLLVYLFWRERNFIDLTKTGTVTALLLLPWLVYNFITFGSIVQTSGTAYPFHLHQQYLNEYQTFFSFHLIWFLLKKGFYSFALNAYHYGNWILTLLIIGILLYRLKGWPRDYRPLLWAPVAAGLFISFHIFFRWSVRPWYAQAIFVLTLPVVALALEKLNRRLLALGMVLALLPIGSDAWSPQLFRRFDRFKIMLQAVREHIPTGDRVGVFNSGYCQYFTDRTVINLDGLVNNEVLPYYKERKGLEYFRKKGIRWLVDFAYWPQVVFGPYFGSKAENSLRVMDASLDSIYVNNTILIVAVLEEGEHETSGLPLELETYREMGPFWGKVPIPFVKR